MFFLVLGRPAHIQAEELFQRLFSYSFTDAVAMGYKTNGASSGIRSLFVFISDCVFMSLKTTMTTKMTRKTVPKTATETTTRTTTKTKTRTIG